MRFQPSSGVVSIHPFMRTVRPIIARFRDTDAFKPVIPLIPVPVKATYGHTRNMGLADGRSF